MAFCLTKICDNLFCDNRISQVSDIKTTVFIGKIK
jgi:hypothetical protein